MVLQIPFFLYFITKVFFLGHVDLLSGKRKSFLLDVIVFSKCHLRIQWPCAEIQACRICTQSDGRN